MLGFVVERSGFSGFFSGLELYERDETKYFRVTCTQPPKDF